MRSLVVGREEGRTPPTLAREVTSPKQGRSTLGLAGCWGNGNYGNYGRDVFAGCGGLREEGGMGGR